MGRLTRQEALTILRECGGFGKDFHELSSGQVDVLLVEADKRKYRKPRDAPGSRARCFYAYVERSAMDRPFSGFIVRGTGIIRY